MFCSNCKLEIPDEANFCPYCSTRVEAPQVVIPKEIQVEPIQFKKKKNIKGKSKIAAIIIIAIIVIAAIIGGVVALSIYNNPLKKLESGYNKLVEADNFTVEVEGEILEYDSVDAEIIYSKDELLYVDFNYDNDFSAEGGIFENNVIISSEEEDESLRVDFTDYLNEGKLDLANLNDLDEKDENYLLTYLASPYVDLKDCNEALETFKTNIIEYIQGEGNIEYEIEENGDNTQFEVELNVHELYEIAYDSLSSAMSAELKEELEDFDDEIKEESKNIDVLLTINLTGREITSIEILIEYEKENVAEFTITISDLNETNTEDCAETLTELKKDASTPEEIYKVITENAYKSNCYANHRLIISQLNNAHMSEMIEFSEDTVIKIVNNDGNASWRFVSGDYSAYTKIPALFGDIPCCPKEGTTLTINVDVTYGYYYDQININVQCSEHGDMYSY